MEETNIEVIDLAGVRQPGASEVTQRALERLGNEALHGFWIHLDADVLDDAVMPALDYRMPNGLHWDELSEIPRRAIGSGRAVGINITVLNLKLDETGAIVRAFVDVLARGLAADAD